MAETHSGIRGMELQIHWPLPPTHYPVETAGVDIWAADLHRSVRQVSEFAATLSKDEQARADRFHFDRDRNRFIVGRGLLRAILARYVGERHAALAFTYGLKGKPALAPTTGKSRLLFNLAHADDLLLLAVSRDCAVGIDVERIRPCEDTETIAASHFSIREASGLRKLPVARRLKAFYRLWTRKEAWLKATGDGISESLSQVEVSFLEDEQARLLSLFGSSETVQDWTLCELLPAPGFLGAMAAPAPDVPLNCWHWPE
jgi:4'-phosphopantetheinyl transferase